ncbi:undecaprenyl-diphosphate phosphatase [bacterium]|nr:undecaprenyl-diphosphate phosphatase [Bacteroidales bacterium]MBD5292432.1 undecaprenyl-diphosphate phosphatase [Bacteroides sp.]MBD5385104.1 undecaprenyl-diphosphate phosphatase [bacterium]
MDWLDALILGLVQGLAEYLPISSSGHLEIFREILGIDIPKDDILQFDIMVHAATVCSTIVVLWPMFYALCKSFFTFKRDDNFWYVCKILISCIPIGIVGVCFKDYVEQFFGDGLTVVGVCLLVTACLLAFAHFSDRIGGRMISPSKGRDITWLDAFVIGCAQALAVLPGLSRSGTTIATGILIGDKREKVASFSFLMVIIPILGEALLDTKDMLTAPAGSQGGIDWSVLLIGFAVAFVVGCAACKWMLQLVKKGKLVWFSIYCVLMGIICLLWQ